MNVISKKEIIDQIPEAIFIIGLDGSIIYYNVACTKLAGRTPSLGVDKWCVVGRLFDSAGRILDPARSAVATALREERPIHGGVLTGERPNGERFSFIYHTTPLYDEHGSLTGAMALLIDVTDQQRAEEHLRQLEAEVVHLGRVAAMSNMGSMLAHELNQPLTAAANYLSGVERVLDAQAAMQDDNVLLGIKEAQNALRRANEIIKSVKNMVAKDAGEITSVSLTDLISDASLLLGPDVIKSITLNIHPESDLVIGNKVQLEQLIINIVKNATEAMGGCDQKRIIINARRCEGHVLVEIIDAGGGIEDSIRTRLFSPFNTSKSDGLGIGLSICHTIIQQHHGRIWAEDVEGGTKFAFTLLYPTVN